MNDRNQDVHYTYPVFEALLYPPEKKGIPLFMANILVYTFSTTLLIGFVTIGVIYAWLVTVPIGLLLYALVRDIHARDPYLFRVIRNRYFRLGYSITYLFWKSDCFGAKGRTMG